MQDLFPKFIIEDRALIIAKVTYHKELVIDKTKVKGGGWFKYNKETNAFILHGESHDFGRAKLEDIQACFAERAVFTNQFSDYDISRKHNFLYDTGSELIVLNGLNSDQNVHGSVATEAESGDELQDNK